MSVSLHRVGGFREMSRFDHTPPAIPAEMRSQLRLGLFGQMTATRGGALVALPKVRKTRALLAIMALAGGRPVLRERIAALLWSRREREQARASLRQCVHELQEFLTQNGQPRLRTGRQHLLLDMERVWVDAVALGSATAAQGALLDIQSGLFLEDLAGLDEAFDHWIATEERRLRAAAIALAGLVLDRQTTPETITAAARRLVELAPANEIGWARLIQAHLDCGERAAADEAFARCSIALQEATGRGPGAEILALMRASPATPHAIVQPSRPVDRRAPGLWLGVTRLRGANPGEGSAVGDELAGQISTNLAAFRWLNLIPASGLENDPDGTSGLDFLLDGALARRGGDLRLTLRLLDLRAGGEMVWSRRFDRTVADDGFWLDDLACEIAAQVEPELLQHEARRVARLPVSDASPRELMLRAIPAIYRLVEPDYGEAGQLLGRAAVLAPNDAAIFGWWASWHLFLVGQSFAADPQSARNRAGELAERAVALDPGCARALSIAAHVRSFLLHKEIDETISLHERALALNPSLPFAWAVSCLSLAYAGRHQEAVVHGERARKLSPFDPHSFFFDGALIVPLFAMGEFERVVTLGRRALAINPWMIGPKKGLLASLGRLGRREEATELLAKMRAQAPGLTLEQAMRQSPLSRAEDRRLYAEGLRLAGLD